MSERERFIALTVLSFNNPDRMRVAQKAAQKLLAAPKPAAHQLSLWDEPVRPVEKPDEEPATRVQTSRPFLFWFLSAVMVLSFLSLLLI